MTDYSQIPNSPVYNYDDELRILATTLFSETKDYDDAEGIANVILNRMKKPERFGGNMVGQVVFQPYQFSGVNGDEWNKAWNNKMTPKEEAIYKRMMIIANKALRGKLEDSTDGADHYVNLKISKPTWAKKYKKTKKIGQHTYFQE